MRALLRVLGRARRPLPVRGDDSGFSLVELLVSMSVLTLLLGAVMTVFVHSLEITGVVRNRTSMSADSRIAMDEITRLVRVAIKPKGMDSALDAGCSANSLVMYSQVERTGTGEYELPPRWISLTHNGQKIVSSTQLLADLPNPGAAGPFYTVSGSPETKNIVTTSTVPTFEYFSSTEVMKNGVTVAPLPFEADGTLSLANRQKVVAIQITLTISEPGNSHTAVVRDRVVLSNVVATGGTN